MPIAPRQQRNAALSYSQTVFFKEPESRAEYQSERLSFAVNASAVVQVSILYCGVGVDRVVHHGVKLEMKDPAIRKRRVASPRPHI